MVEFLRQHASSVMGVINGFDRLRFRGTWRLGANVSGLGKLLRYMGILLKGHRQVDGELHRAGEESVSADS